jgi:hypothetical protein
MDDLKIKIKGNYSKVGKFSAKKFGYVLDKGAHADKILKDKPRKHIVEKNFIDRDDTDSLDKSKDNESIDIFDCKYNNCYINFLEGQKNKYFSIKRTCAINKKLYLEEDKEDEGFQKKFKYHILHHNLFHHKKRLNQGEQFFSFDQNKNNSYIYRKIAYSQSFCKMVGRGDKEKIKKIISKKLEKKKKQNLLKEINEKSNNKNTENASSNSTHKKNKIKKKLKKAIKGIGMDKQLQRGILPEHHDVRIRTAKGLEIKRKNLRKTIRNISSSISSSLLINNNKYLNENRKNMRLFSSIIPNKNLLFINNANDKRNNDNNNNEFKEKRVFSGFNSMNNFNIINRKPCLSTKNLMIQSGKKTIEFNSDITNNNRTTSSYNINKIKRNVNSEKSNSYSFVYKSKIY